MLALHFAGRVVLTVPLPWRPFLPGEPLQFSERLRSVFFLMESAAVRAVASFLINESRWTELAVDRMFEILLVSKLILVPLRQV